MGDEKSNYRDRIWFVVIELLVGITAITGYGVKGIVDTIHDCSIEKTKKLRDKAVIMFKNMAKEDTLSLEVPVRLFHEVYDKIPEDETGYRLLLERAKAIIQARGYRYDRIAEKLLEEAVGLSELPCEAENRLKDIRRLKP